MFWEGACYNEFLVKTVVLLRWREDGGGGIARVFFGGGDSRSIRGGDFLGETNERTNERHAAQCAGGGKRAREERKKPTLNTQLSY